jgi:hypothetical protein
MRTHQNDSMGRKLVWKQASLCNKNCGENFKSYKMYLIKHSNKFIWLTHSFIFPCTHTETAIALQQLEIGPMLF